jgi:hypothetical protein
MTGFGRAERAGERPKSGRHLTIRLVRLNDRWRPFQDIPQPAHERLLLTKAVVRRDRADDGFVPDLAVVSWMNERLLSGAALAGGRPICWRMPPRQAKVGGMLFPSIIAAWRIELVRPPRWIEPRLWEFLSQSRESKMSEPETPSFVADAAKMTDEELLDTWQTATEKETENRSPLLRAVVDEMARRGIAFA